MIKDERSREDIMELENKSVLVVGTGISGVAATTLLNTLNCKITLLDSNMELNKEALLERLPKDASIELVLGELSPEKMNEFDYVVLSPGVPTDLPYINQLRELGKPIIGEIELAFYFEKGQVVAITGTNGKTTTTALTGQIMKRHFTPTLVVGNIGLPYTKKVMETTKDSVTVAEVSSFQLETVVTFKPKVSAILNLSPDHLNRHHTMENYIEAKENVTKNQDAGDTCVLNYEDETLRAFGESLSCDVLFFSSKHVLEKGLYLQGDEIFFAEDGKITVVCNINELKILGTHNYENVMAAVGMAIRMGVPMNVIHDAIVDFVAVEHRIEYVDTIGGVKYYNDSKGTNPDAAIKGIQAMNTPTILIGGGYDKQSTYDEWIEAFDGKVRYLILLGQTREKIADCARAHGFEEIIFVDSLEEAVVKSAALANEGDSVLLSPACASWGMFDNYEQRGDRFKEYVRKLV